MASRPQRPRGRPGSSNETRQTFDVCNIQDNGRQLSQNANQGSGGKESVGELIVAGGQSAVLLELVEEAL